MGSKNKIARQIVEFLPPAKHFYDLFCGGCAASHAAMLSGKYETVTINDISGDMPKFFLDAMAGKYRDETRWISREEFHRLKDSEAYIRCVWSFGNDGKSYLYSEEIEPWKKALHYARVFRDTSLLEEFGQLPMGKSLKYLQSLDNLDRLHSVQSLQRLEQTDIKVKMFSGDYQNVEILPDSVVYCDPPYYGTKEYKDGGFDHRRFWDWIRTRDFPVYVSEYAAPEDFIPVWSKEKTCSYSSTNNSKKTVEHIFLHKRFAESLKVESPVQLELELAI